MMSIKYKIAKQVLEVQEAVRTAEVNLAVV